MGQMKELFISMQEGLLQGSRMDKQVRGRIADEEYQQRSEDSDEAYQILVEFIKQHNDEGKII